MYIVLGNGYKEITVYNVERRHDIDAMLSRIAASYEAMLAVGNPCITRAQSGCKLIFTSDRPTRASLKVNISSRALGIYVDEQAYHRQLAREMFSLTGLDVYQTNDSDADLEFGIGNLDANTQGFVMLKDAILQLISR